MRRTKFSYLSYLLTMHCRIHRFLESVFPCHFRGFREYYITPKSLQKQAEKQYYSTLMRILPRGSVINSVNAVTALYASSLM